MKKIWNKIMIYLKPFLDWKFLVSYLIPFSLINGWAWVGTFLLPIIGSNWFTIAASTWLAILWMPWTPEKLVTIPMAIWIHHLLFKNDKKTKIKMQKMYDEAKKDFNTIKNKFKRHKNKGVLMKNKLDVKKITEEYLNLNDWRVKENSTVTYSVGGLILSNSGAVTANYWLNNIYDKEINKAHRNADIHIHDLSMLTGYCAGWSLKQLIKEGLGGVPGKITSSPASHLSTLCNQMVNFLGIMQNEWAGAQAFSSFDTYLAPFVKVDNLNYKQVKQCIQSFVYGMNTPSRWGCQAPFSNITLDWTVPNDLAEMNAIVGGKEMDFKYKDCVKEMAMVNKAFIEIMIEGDANGRGFQYPIPTYSITRDFDWSETENNKLLFEMTAKYGTPYFSNYINSDMEPSDVRSMCPLHKDENVLVMDDYSKEFHISNIHNLYQGNKKDNKYKIIFNGTIKDAKINKFENLKFYKITLINGHQISVSDNHLNLTLDGIKETKNLNTEDYLPFNIIPIQGKGLSYSDGIMVGAFLGDGCLKDDYTITYSLNETTKKDLMNNIINIAETKFGAKINISKLSNNCVNINITSKMLRGLIEDYVFGTSLTKELNLKCINRSIDFRKGILYGLLHTDGTPNKNRIYTSSINLVKTVCAMLSSLGMSTNISIDDRDKTTTLSDNPIYCIRYYSTDFMLKKYKNIYIKTDDYIWFKIKSIEPISGNIGYCFEVLDDKNPYFMMPNGLITHNCRLRLDLRELRKKSGGFFGSGESTGSVGVVTINMPRIAYLSSTEKEFYDRLKHMMDIAARSLKIKRETITKLLDKGLYPYTKRYLGTFANHFSTIGLVGMNEACLNAKWIKKDLTQPEAQTFTKNVLNFMRNKLSDYQELYGDLYNLEATPAESTSFRLAKHDKKRYPDIITASDCDKTPYYTNSSHLPVGFTDDIFSALDIQDELQTLYTSGTVFHAFLGQKLPDWKAAASLVRKIAENYKLPYYTISPTYSVCADHGYIPGEVYKCPICGKTTEVYSRITGYYRPVQNWNDGKRAEFAARKVYDIANSHFKETCEFCGDINIPEDLGFKESYTTEVLTKPLLFTRNGCPNCKTSKMMLDKAGIKYDVVNAEEDKETTLRFGIKKVPTLLVPDGDDFKVYDNASEIRKYIESIH